MSRPVIETFLIDDENEEKFAKHRVSVRQVLGVLDNVHLVLRNKRNRRGLYLVIGRDSSGLCIAVPVEPTYNPAVWRPITAWPCKSQEYTLLEKRGRQNG